MAYVIKSDKGFYRTINGSFSIDIYDAEIFKHKPDAIYIKNNDEKIIKIEIKEMS